MKKLLFTAFAFSLVSMQLIAQEEVDMSKKITLGAKVGANYSNVYDTKGEQFIAQPKWGYSVGGVLTVPIGKYLGIQPEVLYSQRGFTSTGTLFGAPYSLTRTTSWIDVPVLFQLKAGPSLTILAGPQYSYLVKQNDVFTNGITTVAQQQTFENDNLRKNLFCFTGGVDINISHVVIGGRVGWDLENNNGDGSSSTPRYKNEWYQLSVGFRF
ncbi:MAG: porin family protein [Bacteroidia bacterium]